MWLFALFVAIPMIEIALFIQVGGAIGLWPTLAVVVLTAILGTSLVRSQGAQALMQLRRSFDDLHDPTEPLAHGAMILFAGALLLTPGFFTDTVGLLLLVPGVRKAVYTHLRARVEVQSFRYGTGPDPSRAPRQPGGPGEVIDGDYEEVTPPRRPTHRPSGWTKH